MNLYFKMDKLPSDNLQINLQGLNLSFSNAKGVTQVLHDIHLQLFQGEILAIVGESGSGKSVTSKVLMGLLPQDKTSIDASQATVLGHEILNMEAAEWARFRGSEISMIFQEPMSSLNPTIRLGKQVAEILEVHTKLQSKQRRKRVLELFEKVRLPTPETTYNKFPHEISGGQMQRVMIAMAIACNPKILIADEPTTALDVTVQKEIIELLKSLQVEYGLSILFISHDLALVQSIADRIAVMYQGRIVETAPTTQLFTQPKQDYTKALIAARPETHRRVTRLPTVKDFTNGSYTAVEETRDNRIARHRQLYQANPLLQVRHVVKQYPIKKPVFKASTSFRAVDDVSFELFAKESLGLVGESGCGKSTLGNMILGLLPPTSGSIVFDKIELTTASKKQMRELRHNIQIIFQDPFSSLNPRLTVGKAIEEPMKWHGIGTSDKDRKAQVIQLLERVGLSAGHYDRYPHEFSGGQRQRIGIARAVGLQPKLIVCDESVSALDISVQAQVLNLLNELKEDYGFSYLFISHDLAVVKYFCDRVVVMNKGKIEEQNEADALYEHPQKAYTQKLIDAIP